MKKYYRDRHGTPVPKHILPGGLGQDGDVDNVCERQDWADDLDDLANNSFVWQENFKRVGENHHKRVQRSENVRPRGCRTEDLDLMTSDKKE